MKVKVKINETLLKWNDRIHDLHFEIQTLQDHQSFTQTTQLSNDCVFSSVEDEYT